MRFIKESIQCQYRTRRLIWKVVFLKAEIFLKSDWNYTAREKADPVKCLGAYQLLLYDKDGMAGHCDSCIKREYMCCKSSLLPGLLV